MQEKLSTQYNEAVQQIKTAILRSQAKALAGVNQEQLALYYGIGRYISQNSRGGLTCGFPPSCVPLVASEQSSSARLGRA